jgi:hypothetical protein
LVCCSQLLVNLRYLGICNSLSERLRGKFVDAALALEDVV